MEKLKEAWRRGGNWGEGIVGGLGIAAVLGFGVAVGIDSKLHPREKKCEYGTIDNLPAECKEINSQSMEFRGKRGAPYLVLQCEDTDGKTILYYRPAKLCPGMEKAMCWDRVDGIE